MQANEGTDTAVVPYEVAATIELIPARVNCRPKPSPTPPIPTLLNELLNGNSLFDKIDTTHIQHDIYSEVSISKMDISCSADIDIQELKKEFDST